MKALILVGGYGTRLRPLTLSVPKPLVQFCNKSIVEHQIAALVKAGVNHVILAVAYKPEQMLEALKNLEEKYGIKITCSHEKVPLGTGGPIKLAEKELLDGSNPNDSFFMCNSDVICDFPFHELYENHKKTSSEGTILITKVKEPFKFGVVIHEDSGKVNRFAEKPKEFVGDWVNAGIYILKNKIINRIPLKKTSIETEIFPEMADEGNLYCMKLSGYWSDIGKPNDYILGMGLYLDNISKVKNNSEQDKVIPETLHGCEFIGNTLIDDSVKLGKNCCIGPNVTIDENCVIGDGCRIKNTAIMQGVTVENFSWISNSIIGWNSKIGKWVRIDGISVIGEDVEIIDECYINEALILPNKSISDSITVGGTIVM